MARLIDPGPTGKIDNLIFYSMNGKKYVRSMPTRVKQTKATKARATEFGKASTIGAMIRRGLNQVIPDALNKKMQIRLVSGIFQWLNRLADVKFIPGFQSKNLSGFSFMENGRSFHATQTISHSLPTPKESLILTGMRLVFMGSKYVNTEPNKNKAYMPAEIVEAMYL